MPKWKDQRSQIPTIKGVSGRKRRDHPVVDISPPAPEPEPVKEARTPKASKPERSHPEFLTIDTTPTEHGVRVEIENFIPTETYIVILLHQETGEIFGTSPDSWRKVIPIANLSRRTGKWTSHLIIGKTIHQTDEFELDLSDQWLADTVKEVDIRFATTDGVINRIGSIRVNPGPKGQTLQVDPDREDFAICFLLPDLPDSGIEGKELTIQVHRPKDAGLYYTGTVPLAEVLGMKVNVRDHFPATEPGAWRVYALIGSKVLGTAEFRMKRGGPSEPNVADMAVEEFPISLAP